MGKRFENFTITVAKLHRLDINQDKEEVYGKYLDDLKDKSYRKSTYRIVRKSKDIVPVLIPLLKGPIANVANAIMFTPKESFTSKTRKSRKGGSAKAA